MEPILTPDKKRFSVTLTEAYIEALKSLINEGLYMDHQDAIRDSLRQLFRYHKLQPFFDKLVEEAVEN